MLSVLIPTYNYNAYPLVSELKKQADSLNFKYEILVQDDGSNSDLNLLNSKINLLDSCQFRSNDTNVGRGRNINSLAENAIYDWFLILDCDMFPASPDFLKNYCNAITKNTEEVVYGGILYEEKKPRPESLLRWIYGKQREALTLRKRKDNPYTTCLTSNLLVKKRVFSLNPFPEQITNYGYEDLVWIKKLKNIFIPILHIDNPAFHLNLETSEIFITKIRESLDNLKIISNLDLISSSDTKILSTYRIIAKLGLHYFMKLLFVAFHKKAEKNLLSDNPSLHLLDIYKLGYFCKINS